MRENGMYFIEPDCARKHFHDTFSDPHDMSDLGDLHHGPENPYAMQWRSAQDAHR